MNNYLSEEMTSLFENALVKNKQGCLYYQYEEIEKSKEFQLKILFDTINKIINEANFTFNKEQKFSINFCISRDEKAIGKCVRILENKYVIIIDYIWMWKLFNILHNFLTKENITDLFFSEEYIEEMKEKFLKYENDDEYCPFYWQKISRFIAERSWRNVIEFITIHEIVHFLNGHLEYLHKHSLPYIDDYGWMNRTREDLEFTIRSLEFDADAVSYTFCLNQATNSLAVGIYNDEIYINLETMAHSERVLYFGIAMFMDYVHYLDSGKRIWEGTHSPPRHRLMQLANTSYGYHEFNFPDSKITKERHFIEIITTTIISMCELVYKEESQNIVDNIRLLNFEEPEYIKKVMARWSRIYPLLNEYKYTTEITPPTGDII